MGAWFVILFVIFFEIVYFTRKYAVNNFGLWTMFMLLIDMNLFLVGVAAMPWIALALRGVGIV